MTGVLLFSVLLLAWSSASSPEQWTSCRESSCPHRFTLFQKNVCNLHLIADPTLWRHFKYERFGTVLTDEQTSERIETFFAGHVSALKRIFGDTEFTTYDGRETWRGLDFQMDRSTIMTDTTAKCNTRDESFLCWPDLKPNELLFSISTRNHDEHCLAIYFTYRQTYGVLSGTHKPFPDKPQGGVCGRYVKYTTETGKKYISNSAMWVTLVDKHKTLTEGASHNLVAITMADALGSTLGEGPGCVPGVESPAADFLYQALPYLNEHKGFSRCSKDGIARFLSSIVYGTHGRNNNCLKPSISGGGLLHGFVDPEMCSEKDNQYFSDHDFNTKDEL